MIEPARYAAAEARSKDAERAVKDAAPWLRDFAVMAFRIAEENASPRAKYRRLVALADRFNEAVAPHAVCSQGCAGCCHIDVVIFSAEALVIAQATGRIPQTPAKSAQTWEEGEREKMRVRFFGTPCPFLKDRQCSIYAVRPLACRLHHNLGDAFFCSPEVPPADSLVTYLNTFPVLIAATAVLGRAPIADIRDFFPGDK